MLKCCVCVPAKFYSLLGRVGAHSNTQRALTMGKQGCSAMRLAIKIIYVWDMLVDLYKVLCYMKQIYGAR